MVKYVATTALSKCRSSDCLRDCRIVKSLDELPVVLASMFFRNSVRSPSQDALAADGPWSDRPRLRSVAQWPPQSDPRSPYDDDLHGGVLVWPIAKRSRSSPSRGRLQPRRHRCGTQIALHWSIRMDQSGMA